MATSKGGRRGQQRQEAVALVTMKGVDLQEFKPTFDQYERNNGIPLAEVLEKLTFAYHGEELPLEMRQRLIRRADEDRNGRLNWAEFYDLMTVGEGRNMQAVPLTRFQKVVRTAVSSVVPKGRTLDDGETDVVEDYIQHYNCLPPPLFMIVVSLVELGIFIYYAIDQMNKEPPVRTTMISGAPTYSALIYQPTRRYEAWRFGSYMFIHDGIKHLISNLIFQLLVGIPLEMVHKFWRVGTVYILGVIAGSLATSITDPWTLLCGASGGCYSLIGAHFAIVIMNWQDMTHDWMEGPVKFLLSAPVRLAFWTLYAAVDTGVAIYTRYVADRHVATAYAAHFAGALAGLLVGIPVLKNFKVLEWEKILRWISLSVYLLLVVLGVGFNVFFVSHYPPTDWSSCCGYPNYHYVAPTTRAPSLGNSTNRG